ncbi:MAG: hypothetical protein JWQ72_1285 [Polaromonas sp.]|nr:hypothetical protein [Polaromonas sp.]
MPITLAIDTDDFIAACTPPALSNADILDCFNAVPVGDGRGGYLVAVGRAIEAKAREAFEARLDLVGYQWAGCFYRLEETYAYHRAEGAALFRLRQPAALATPQARA